AYTSIDPRKLSCPSASATSLFPFNPAWGWGDRDEQAVKRLGELIREQLA
ncbi:GntR family transcriptional regulator, partial [Klebsiella pneumoniae]